MSVFDIDGYKTNFPQSVHLLSHFMFNINYY